MCVKVRLSTFKRGESWGSPMDLGQKLLVQRTEGLVNPVIIRCSFHVYRKFASKVGEQHYDFTLRIIRGRRRELVDLGFRLLQQVLQFICKFR